MPSQTFADKTHVGVYTTDYGDVTNYDVALLQGKRQLIWSHGNHGYPHFPPNRDVGGDFKVVYNYAELGTASIGKIQGGNAYAQHHYSGNVWGFLNTYTDAPQLTGAAWGAEAYAKMKPDRALMQGFVSAYELKDLPGMLQQRFLKSGLHKFTGDYFLAEKFGWEALLKDVVSLISSQIQWQKRLDQLIRDESKLVRHRINLAASEVYDPPTLGTGNFQGPGFVTYFYSAPGNYRLQKIQRDIVWASAAYRYSLPPGPRNIEWTRKMKSRIFGFRPTPHQVYNVIPWSWLFEWFGHIGNVLDNTSLNVVESLYAQWFYVMRQNETEVRTDCTSSYFEDKTLRPFAVTTQSRLRSGCKTRLRGDPFGFGTSNNSLTGSQLAIMGALGLSRLG